MRRLFKARVRGKCGSCLTGKKTYELDKREPMCPYIGGYKHKLRKCSHYVKLDEEKDGILKRLFNKVGCFTPPPEKIAL